MSDKKIKDREQWYKVRYIYKDAELNLREGMEPWEKDAEMAKLEDAEVVVINKWILAADVYCVEEATTKAKERFMRNDIYLVFISGDTGLHCVIKDIDRFLSEVGPYKHD